MWLFDNPCCRWLRTAFETSNDKRTGRVEGRDNHLESGGRRTAGRGSVRVSPHAFCPRPSPFSLRERGAHVVTPRSLAVASPSAFIPPSRQTTLWLVSRCSRCWGDPAEPVPSVAGPPVANWHRHARSRRRRHDAAEGRGDPGASLCALPTFRHLEEPLERVPARPGTGAAYVPCVGAVLTVVAMRVLPARRRLHCTRSGPAVLSHGV